MLKPPEATAAYCRATSCQNWNLGEQFSCTIWHLTCQSQDLLSLWLILTPSVLLLLLDFTRRVLDLVCYFLSIDAIGPPARGVIRIMKTVQNIDSPALLHTSQERGKPIALSCEDLDADLIDFQNAVSTVSQSSLSQICDDTSMPFEVVHFCPSVPKFGSPLHRVIPAFESGFLDLCVTL